MSAWQTKSYFRQPDANRNSACGSLLHVQACHVASAHLRDAFNDADNASRLAPKAAQPAYREKSARGRLWGPMSSEGRKRGKGQSCPKTGATTGVRLGPTKERQGFLRSACRAQGEERERGGFKSGACLLECCGVEAGEFEP